MKMRANEWVEVRSKQEILQTLDENGRLDGMPFMPQMFQYCGKRFRRAELNLDHVVPRSRGGGTNWENVVCSCIACNLRKGGRTPDEAGMRLLHAPARPRWTPMFRSATRRAFYREWRPFLSLADAAYWNTELVEETPRSD